MTISQFSERTGLRPKLLRYYEETGLIVPELRAENGYRQYSEAQIETAQLVNSLRQAGIPMADIREFLTASAERRNELLDEWRIMAETRLLSVKVAHQFLQGFDARMSRMYLVHWERPRTLAWCPLPESASGGELAAEAERLCRSALRPAAPSERAGYIRFASRESDAEGSRAEAGFIVEGAAPLPAGWRLETCPPTLFATMDCEWEMNASCVPMLSIVNRFRFEATGEPLRRIAFGQTDSYTLMVPVVSRREGRGGAGA